MSMLPMCKGPKSIQIYINYLIITFTKFCWRGRSNIQIPPLLLSSSWINIRIRIGGLGFVRLILLFLPSLLHCSPYLRQTGFFAWSKQARKSQHLKRKKSVVFFFISLDSWILDHLSLREEQWVIKWFQIILRIIKRSNLWDLDNTGLDLDLLGLGLILKC